VCVSEVLGGWVWVVVGWVMEGGFWGVGGGGGGGGENAPDLEFAQNRFARFGFLPK